MKDFEHAKSCMCPECDSISDLDLLAQILKKAGQTLIGVTDTMADMGGQK